MKRAERRRSGRKVLTQDLEQLPLGQVAPGQYEAATRARTAPAGLTVQLAGGSVVWQAAVARSAPREVADISAFLKQVLGAAASAA
jgi:hypothetical protein